MVESYPLQWPPGWPRNTYARFSNFKISRARAIHGIMSEIKLLKGSNVVISTNVPVTKTGSLYDKGGEPADTGIAVYFTLAGVQKCFPCDKWKRVEDNLRAVELTIAAIRGIDRWGSKNMVDAAFQGFKALPEHTIANEDRKRYFSGMKKSEAITVFKELAKKMHPDLGGDSQEFSNMKEEYDGLEE